MGIATVAQTLQVDDLTKIELTDVDADPESGDYVRSLLFYGSPLTPGGQAPVVLTIKARASAQAAIQITIPPELAF